MRPGVYTNVSAYTTWILSTIQSSAPEDRSFSPSLAGIVLSALFLLLGPLEAPLSPWGLPNCAAQP